MRPEAIREVGGRSEQVPTTASRVCLLCGSAGHSVQKDLRWCSSCAVGWSTQDFDMSVYNAAYLDEYIRRSKTKMSNKLNSARMGELLLLLDSHKLPSKTLIDYGCGAGAFVEKAAGRFRCCGLDVSRDAVSYCAKRTVLATFLWAPWGAVPYPLRADVITFFDSLEHVPNPVGLLLDCEASALLISTPTFTSSEHVRWSKHFKPLEHMWYFTSESMAAILERTGYKLASVSPFESVLGREDILTFGAVRHDPFNT